MKKIILILLLIHLPSLEAKSFNSLFDKYLESNLSLYDTKNYSNKIYKQAIDKHYGIKSSLYLSSSLSYSSSNLTTVLIDNKVLVKNDTNTIFSNLGAGLDIKKRLFIQGKTKLLKKKRSLGNLENSNKIQMLKKELRKIFLSNILSYQMLKNEFEITKKFLVELKQTRKRASSMVKVGILRSYQLDPINSEIDNQLVIKESISHSISKLEKSLRLYISLKDIRSFNGIIEKSKNSYCKDLAKETLIIQMQQQKNDQILQKKTTSLSLRGKFSLNSAANLKTNSQDIQLGIALNIPLFNKGHQANNLKHIMKKIKKHKVLKEQVREDTRSEVIYIKKRISIEKDNLRKMNRKYSSRKKHFKAGLIRITPYIKYLENILSLKKSINHLKSRLSLINNQELCEEVL